MRAAPNHSRRRAVPGVALAQLLACSPATKLPASDAAPVAEPAQPVVAPAPAPATPPVAPVVTAPAPSPAVATAPAAPRECRNGERLDSGCECRSGGACFDICCGPNAGCAHPAEPGGPSACMLRMTDPPKPAKPCTDGQFLSDGCKCEGKTCMDICCVGSTCTHHASEAGGYAKCISRR